ncbi:hypothetical protein GQ464_006710 [Rhodocaloribacter litoris]|uniref:hypothetical protein n=1 Tax=Rhodocaloribacter litoris TaxID=2558931 RepID=UPI0014242212|nr:hypothetical protein [Rhodocaloribacter litoris]QXD16626.1 hypothetical protein GQ464_006710 [Rhodocaloribacter litoris]
MNLAFPALLVFLLILPGLLLSYAYRKGFSWRSPVSFSSLPGEIARGVLLAILLHLFGILIVQKCFGKTIDYSAILVLLLGQANPESREGAHALRAVSEHAHSILLYFLSLSLIGGFGLGYGVHWLVRRLRLDLRWDALRFDNDWYYLFTGEVRVFDLVQQDRTPERLHALLEKERVVCVFIAAVVEQGGSAFLYWGILSDFFFDVTGKLDRIVLQSAHRRSLAQDRAEESTLPSESEAYYPIHGHYFVLPFHHIRNLNVEYYISSGEPPEGETPVEIRL